MIRSRSQSPQRARAGGFTIIELVVVMGIIVVLIGITLVAVGAIAKSSRLATGTNRVKSALGQARAMAMLKRKPVGVVFRVKWNRLDSDIDQLTEIVIVEWSGSATVVVLDNNNLPKVVNRYVPAPGVDRLYLPAGIKVAAMSAAFNGWMSQPQFPLALPQVGREAPVRMMGVLFDQDGALITQVPESDANERWVDLDLFQQNGQWVPNFGNTLGTLREQFERYDEPDDEVALLWATILSVYDDKELRRDFKQLDWSNGNNRNQELSDYIIEFANMLYFNRYTGVAMR